MTRRHFTHAALLAAGTPFALSEAHRRAVNRRRRIAVQFDAADHRHVRASSPEEWLRYIFAFPDEPGSQIDSILWDIGMGDWAVYPSNVLAPTRDRRIAEWREQGFDWVAALVAGCRKRGLEVFWNHRFSEVDIRPEGGLELKTMHPFKAQHPDWLIRSWWWQGLWNAAVPGVREYKVRILRELAMNYELDGIRIDFARHVPCLPPGRQWEHREGVTELLRMLRTAFRQVEKEKGRPVLLAAKVPQTLEGCRTDGFDVATWARENLVDILTLGSRSIDVDVQGIRRAVGPGVKLMPCHDDHHATDGYRYPPIEFFRGVFANWWRQGADSVSTFNWAAAPAGWAERVGGRVAPPSQQQAYREIGDPDAMRGKDKTFAVERRGGYPWAEGFFNRNDGAPLPVVLANDGRPAAFSLRVSDDPAGDARVQATLRLVLFRAAAADRLEVVLNGRTLALAGQDAQWKDPQIASPRPQTTSGGKGEYKVDPAQRLLLSTFAIPAGALRAGVNQVTVRVLAREPFAPGIDIQLEKLEAALRYQPIT